MFFFLDQIRNFSHQQKVSSKGEANSVALCVNSIWPSLQVIFLDFASFSPFLSLLPPLAYSKCSGS